MTKNKKHLSGIEPMALWRRIRFSLSLSLYWQSYRAACNKRKSIVSFVLNLWTWFIKLQEIFFYAWFVMQLIHFHVFLNNLKVLFEVLVTKTSLNFYHKSSCTLYRSIIALRTGKNRLKLAHVKLIFIIGSNAYHQHPTISPSFSLKINIFLSSS